LFFGKLSLANYSQNFFKKIGYNFIMKVFRRVVLLFGIIFLIYWVGRGLGNKNSFKETAYFGQKKLFLEIATTASQKQQGLSDRDNLCSDCGMFFVFDSPGIYPFWMKKMHFDIDILWLADNRVVEIIEAVKKPKPVDFDQPKEIYQNIIPADRVLEVNSGWVAKNNIKIGDELRFASD